MQDYNSVLQYNAGFHLQCGDGDMVMCINHFPFKAKLSLVPLIAYWRNKLVGDFELGKAMVAELLKQVDKIPDLHAPIDDLTIVDQHRALIDTLLTAVFAPALQDEDISAAIVPYGYYHLYATEKFRGVMPMDMAEMQRRIVFDEKTLFYKSLHAYTIILKQLYDVDVVLDKSIIIPILDSDTGLKKYFKATFNPRFTEVKQVTEGRKLSQEDIAYLLNNMNNLDLWMDYMPPENFEFQGFVVMHSQRS